MVGFLWAMGVRAEPSLIRTLPGSCGLSSLRDEVQTLPFACHPPPGDSCSLSSLQDEVWALPGSWAHSRLLGTLPWVMPVVSAPSEMRCVHSPVVGHPPPGDACRLSSLRDEMRALLGGWVHSWLLGTLSQVVLVVSAPSEMRCVHSLVDGHTPGCWAPSPGWFL